MSVGTLVALMVLVESIVLFVAVRWLIGGLHSSACREWPPVIPLASAHAVPVPRESAPRSEEQIAAAS